MDADQLGGILAALATGIPVLVGAVRAIGPRADRALAIAESAVDSIRELVIEARGIRERLEGADYVRLPRREVEAELGTMLRRLDTPPAQG